MLEHPRLSDVGCLSACPSLRALALCKGSSFTGFVHILPWHKLNSHLKSGNSQEEAINHFKIQLDP